jgi:hypothetical protein
VHVKYVIKEEIVGIVWHGFNIDGKLVTYCETELKTKQFPTGR